MKFSCEKALLQSAILTASRAVSPKSSIPALEGLLLEVEKQLSITGYNLETGIRVTLEADIQKPGSVVLPARLISEIVRKMPDDVVTLTVEKLSVSIVCGYSQFQLQGIDPEEFPQLPDVEAKSNFSLPESALRSMISQTLFAVSDNESRPIHTGSLFEVEKDRVTAVSVDGFRLALRRAPLSSSFGESSFVVPGSALGEIGRAHV